MGGVDAGRRLEHLQNVITMLESFESKAREGIYDQRNSVNEEVRNCFVIVPLADNLVLLIEYD